MASKYWLVKSEPSTYSWDTFVKDRGTLWDGVRNYTARNNLRAMKKGDLVLFYHSVNGKEVVGVAKVAREAYPDPTAKEGDWSVVDLVPIKPLEKPVTLAELRQDAAFAEMQILNRPRLSVMPVSAPHFRRILKLGQTKL